MSRRSLALLALVATLLLVVFGGALALRLYRGAPLGPLPVEALDLPSGTSLVAGLNIPAALASPAWLRPALGERDTLHEKLRALEQESGLALERDVQHVVVAVDDLSASHPRYALVVIGRFESQRVLDALSLSARGQGPTIRAAGGAALHVVAEDTAEPFGFASPARGLLVAGRPALVASFLESHARRARPLTSNRRMAELLRSVAADAPLWLVADQNALGQRLAGLGRTPVPRPRALTVAVAPDGALELAAEMDDAATAEKAAQTLQGFLALARIEGARRAARPETPDLSRSLERVTIRADGRLTRATLPPVATRALVVLALARFKPAITPAGAGGGDASAAPAD